MNKEISLKDIFPLIDEQLNNGGSASFTVHGRSMQPFLKDRKDSVRLTRLCGAPKKYDIIFYRRDDGAFILHRIIGVRRNGFICRGDNQTENEFPVNLDSIIGIVTEYNRGKGWRRMDCFAQKAFALLWVNTMYFRKIKRKIFSLFRKK